MTRNERVICPKCGKPGLRALEKTRCGRKDCKCYTQNILHGPYWYVWHNKNGQRIHHYIGKEWPEEPSKRFPYVKGDKEGKTNIRSQ